MSLIQNLSSVCFVILFFIIKSKKNGHIVFIIPTRRFLSLFFHFQLLNTGPELIQFLETLDEDSPLDRSKLFRCSTAPYRTALHCIAMHNTIRLQVVYRRSNIRSCQILLLWKKYYFLTILDLIPNGMQHIHLLSYCATRRSRTEVKMLRKCKNWKRIFLRILKYVDEMFVTDGGARKRILAVIAQYVL